MPTEHKTKITELFNLVFTLPAQPIRSFYLTIGHAHVAAAALLMYAALAYTVAVWFLNFDRNLASSRQMNASAARVEIQNAEKNPWTFMGVQPSPTSVDVIVPVRADTTSVRFGWSSGRYSGIVTVDASSFAGTDHTFTLEDVQFGPAWSPGIPINIKAEQVTAAGSVTPYTGETRMTRVPETP